MRIDPLIPPLTGEDLYGGRPAGREEPLVEEGEYVELTGATFGPEAAGSDPLTSEEPRARRAGSGEGEGAALLDEVAEFIGLFVAFPSPAALVAVVLWVAHAHAVNAFDSTPRLALLSPEPGSGKTRVLEVLELLVRTPMHVLSASVAAIFRSIEAKQPTLLFDEVDAIFGRTGRGDDAEDLRGLLNAGHRSGATVPRCVGPTHEVREFPVFTPVALAGLGDLPDTLMSRSVIIRMRRRGPTEHVRPFRRRAVEAQGSGLRGRLEEWTGRIEDDLADAWPEMPEGVTDRPADVWEALLAIADAAGNDWPERARTACQELCKVSVSREASLGIRLLTDIRAIFGPNERLFTDTILKSLHALDESPWADLRGKPLDARGLARRLGQYEVESRSVRIGDRTAKGYAAEDLWDTWQRYCPPPIKDASHPAQRSHPEDVTHVTHVTDRRGPAGRDGVDR